MAKKLIITEEQYSRLQNQLTESMDINATLKQAKIGDVLLFKGVNSVLKIKVVNINPTNGDIMGDTEKGDKVTFNINSYNQTTKKIISPKHVRKERTKFF
jgi:septum formation inhibitor-activating ATPase MinD